MVKIDTNLEAHVVKTYIASSKQTDNGLIYTLGKPENLGPNKKPKFTTSGSVVLPNDHEVDMVFLGRESAKGLYMQTLMGVRLLPDSQYFNQFTKGPFITGVVYDITDGNQKFYDETKATQPVAKKAIKELYHHTIDPRKLPDGLEIAEKMVIIHKRVNEKMNTLTPPPTTARGWADLTLCQRI
jgi:hypothetical protein